MYCPSCGKPTPDGSQFCHYCGASIAVPHPVTWEYCCLHSWYASYAKEKKGESSNPIVIVFLGAAGTTKRVVPKEKLIYNGWEKALGLLGGSGWELVNIQHGISITTGSSFISNSGGLDISNSVAYFKRPAISGRAVDEPELNIALFYDDGQG